MVLRNKSVDLMDRVVLTINKITPFTLTSAEISGTSARVPGKCPKLANFLNEHADRTSIFVRPHPGDNSSFTRNVIWQTTGIK